jgi:hypothetical protein
MAELRSRNGTHTMGELHVSVCVLCNFAFVTPPCSHCQAPSWATTRSTRTAAARHSNCLSSRVSSGHCWPQHRTCLATMPDVRSWRSLRRDRRASRGCETEVPRRKQQRLVTVARPDKGRPEGAHWTASLNGIGSVGPIVTGCWVEWVDTNHNHDNNITHRFCRRHARDVTLSGATLSGSIARSRSISSAAGGR